MSELEPMPTPHPHLTISLLLTLDLSSPQKANSIVILRQILPQFYPENGQSPCEVTGCGTTAHLSPDSTTLSPHHPRLLLQLVFQSQLLVQQTLQG